MSRARRLARMILGPSDYDEVMVARKVLPRTGYMVDVGAHYGNALREFAASGWDVLALEPDPNNREHLLANVRPNVIVDPRAVTETDGESLTLFTSEVSTGISSLAPFHESHRGSSTVETVRLDTLLEQHGSPAVTFLKVDTEGFDLSVLRTFPWASQKPDVVVCEFEDRKTLPLGYSYLDMAEFLKDLGYVVLLSEWYPIVEYGQSHRWRRIVKYPAVLRDNNGWGNFVAVSPEMAARTLRAGQIAGARLKVRNVCVRILGRRARRVGADEQ